MVYLDGLMAVEPIHVENYPTMLGSRGTLACCCNASSERWALIADATCKELQHTSSLLTHTYTHTHYTHARTHAHARTHTHTRTHARTHARTHTHTHAYTHARTHAHTHTHLDPLGHTKGKKPTPVPLHGQAVALHLPPPVQCVEEPGSQDLSRSHSKQ